MFLAVVFAAVSVFAAETEPIVDIKPFAGRVYGVRKAEAVDSMTIRVTLGASSMPLARKMAERWRITSTDDADYAYEKFVKPVSATEVSDAEEFVGLRNVFSAGGGKLLCEFGNGYSPEAGNMTTAWNIKVNGQPVRRSGIGS